MLSRFIRHLQTGISIKERIFCTFLMYLLFSIAYVTANRFIDPGSCHDISTHLDRSLPFIPGFIYPYFFIYIFSILPALVIEDREYFFRAVAGFSVLIIATAAIFVLFPVTVPRLYEMPSGITGLLYAQLGMIDNPVCGFPSMHVGLTVLATLIVFSENRVIGWLSAAFAAVTVISTLLTKQHVLWDVIGGIMMAFSVYFIVVKNMMGQVLPSELARQEISRVISRFKL